VGAAVVVADAADAKAAEVTAAVVAVEGIATGSSLPAFQRENSERPLRGLRPFSFCVAIQAIAASCFDAEAGTSVNVTCPPL
jgi:hypothetical protein